MEHSLHGIQTSFKGQIRSRLLKPPHGFPVALRIKSQVLAMACEACSILRPPSQQPLSSTCCCLGSAPPRAPPPTPPQPQGRPLETLPDNTEQSRAVATACHVASSILPGTYLSLNRSRLCWVFFSCLSWHERRDHVFPVPSCVSSI